MSTPPQPPPPPPPPPAATPPQTVILITGANRGIGRGLAEIYLSRPSHVLLALVRDPSSDTSQSLLHHPSCAANSHTILIPYDASKPDAAITALHQIQTQTQTQTKSKVTQIDLVISNAGTSEYTGPSLSAPVDAYVTHYTVNALSHLLLFGATLRLMRAATAPKFIVVSSATGSTALLGSAKMRVGKDGKPRGGALPYTTAKCALNHMIVKLDLEYPDVAVGLFTPGPTRTGLGSGRFNWDLIPNVMDVGTVVEGLVNQFDRVRNLKIEAEGKDGERYRLVLKDWKGDVIPW